MNEISITVSNIALVLEQYDTIQVYSQDAATPVPFTNLLGTIPIEQYTTTYWYTDPDGTSTTWYATQYINSVTEAQSSQSTPFLAGTPSQVGYTFHNYSAPTTGWGKALTADDMRYTYLWGIDTTASNVNMSEWQDTQWDYIVESAVADWERFLGMDIRRRRYMTRPGSTAYSTVAPGATPVQSPYWYPSCDYTDEEMTYDFDPQLFANFGFLQLRHFPIIDISKAWAVSVVGGVILDFLGQQWVRLQKSYGQVSLYPTNGWAYGPFTYGLNIWNLGWNYKYPDGLWFDYDSGFVSSDFIPKDLRNMIGLWATLQALHVIGDGLLAGFSSESVSLDGLSESFSSTQSPENPFFWWPYKDHRTADTNLDSTQPQQVPDTDEFCGYLAKVAA